MSDVAAHGGAGRRPWLRLRAEGDELRHLLGSRSGKALASAVAAVALLTVAGLLALWPHGWHPLAKPTSGTVPNVEHVTESPCVVGTMKGACRAITVTVEGRTKRYQLGPVRNAPAVGVGDQVRLLRTGDPNVEPDTAGYVHYDFVEVDRRGSMLWVAIALAALAAGLLRWRGILAIVGVVVSVAVLLGFLVPAILAGKPALLVALVVADGHVRHAAVTNGLGVQTLSAALGISATLVFTCVVAYAAVNFTDLDGTSDLEMLTIKAGSQMLSLKGVILAGMLIGALGVLADTAVTQASAVRALRRANPRYGVLELYREGFTIGRDHLSATVHTLVLAYAGASLPLLLQFSAGNLTTVDTINSQSLAVPIMATLVGCLALMAAVPVSTGLSAALLARLPLDALPDDHHHHHH